MHAIHDQFSRQIRNRLQTTAMGLGLVRLLQDAKRFEEAGSVLSSLENGFQGVERRSETEPFYTESLSGSPGTLIAAVATPPCHF